MERRCRYLRGVYWLRRPPYLRWIIAASLVGLGLINGVAEEDTERYPFATRAIETGTDIADAIEWRTVPAGLLPAWQDPVAGAAAREVPAGHPLLPGAGGEEVIPNGWWSIPVSLPVAATPGTPLRLLDSFTGEIVDGILATAGTDDGFDTVAMVEFSPDDAQRAAQTVAGDAFVVMIGHSDGMADGNG